MSLKKLQVKVEAEIADAHLKLESTYCMLVEAGKNGTAALRAEYLSAIDELNVAYAKAKAYQRKADSFLRRNGKRIVFGGLIVLAILSVGYISGYFAV